MPKIIKRGALPEEKIYQVTCGKCNSIIEYKEKEGQKQYDQRDGNFITFIWAVCISPITSHLPHTIDTSKERR